MARPTLEFWFDFASTYSYLSALRLPALAAAAGVAVRWRPVLLGPIFKAQGWNTSPFNIYAAKGVYMWRDMARLCDTLGLTLQRPDPFPQNSLLAARAALAARDTPDAAAFCQNVFLAEFDAAQDISDPDVIAACLAAAGLPPGLLHQASTNKTKHTLRLENEEAVRRGIFGAPSFLVENELFWGDDRMEEALDWAVTHG